MTVTYSNQFTLAVAYGRDCEISAFEYASVGDALRMLATFMDDALTISATLSRHDGDDDIVLFDSDEV